MLIYLDYAANTPVLQTSLRVFNSRCLNYTGNPNSIHASGTRVNEDLEAHKKIVASCLNCDPEQVIFTSSATESCRLAAIRLLNDYRDALCSSYEHDAVYKRLPDYGKIYSNVRKKEAALAHIHTCNETGFIYDLKNTGAWNIRFSDCTAAMGKFQLNYKSDAIDCIAGGGHKFGAPVGVGVLIAKDPERIYELEHFATPSVALTAAFSQALWFRTQHLSEFAEMAGRLHDRLIDGIMNEIPDAKLNGHVYAGNSALQSPYIANISFPGVENTALVLRLSSMNVMASGGAACSSGDNKPSRVLLAAGYPEERARSAVRFSFDYTLRLPIDEYQPGFGAEQEKDFAKIDRAVKITADCVKELRNLCPKHL